MRVCHAIALSKQVTYNEEYAKMQDLDMKNGDRFSRRIISLLKYDEPIRDLRAMIVTKLMRQCVNDALGYAIASK
jgi:hypothetical protein